ncbi:hypothetical protein B0J14DRAFT_76197 [Halenospora varia]|nr:hypothetical protein B0J14DRAFT_76197 [Halenospora varia]
MCKLLKLPRLPISTSPLAPFPHLSKKLYKPPSPPPIPPSFFPLQLPLPLWLRSSVVSVLPSLIPGAVDLVPHRFCRITYFLNGVGVSLCLRSGTGLCVPGLTLFPGDANSVVAIFVFVFVAVLVWDGAVRKMSEGGRGGVERVCGKGVAEVDCYWEWRAVWCTLKG